MEIQNNNLNQEKSAGKSYIKYVLIFLVIVLVVGGGYFVWRQYLSSEAKRNKEDKAKMEAYEKYLDIFRKDTYGGKTPQETLDLFVAALEKDDIELASKYFMPDDNGSVEKWRKILIIAKEKDEISRAVDLIKRAMLVNTIGDKIAIFETRDINNKLEAYIEVSFSGKLWKIKKL